MTVHALVDLVKAWWLVPAPLLFAILFRTLLGIKRDDAFFKSMKKPWCQPPPQVFMIMGPGTYFMVGYVLKCLYESDASLQNHPSFLPSVYFLLASLVLSYVWSLIFLRYRRVGVAFLESLFMVITVAISIFFMRDVSERASRLLQPYFTWYAFITYINYRWWVDTNPQKLSKSGAQKKK